RQLGVGAFEVRVERELSTDLRAERTPREIAYERRELCEMHVRHVQIDVPHEIAPRARIVPAPAERPPAEDADAEHVLERAAHARLHVAILDAQRQRAV